MAGKAIKGGGLVLKNGKLCDRCCQPTAPFDHCCFLDPNAAETYNPATTYNTDDLVEIGGPGTSRHMCGTFRSRLDGNVGNVPVAYGPTCRKINLNWWEFVSQAISCGNDDWDQYAGYGGFGGTPGYMSMTGKITWPTLGVSKFHHPSIPRTSINSWAANMYDSQGQWLELLISSFYIGQIADPSTTTVYIWTSANESACNQMPEVGYTFYQLRADLTPGCLLHGEFTEADFSIWATSGLKAEPATCEEASGMEWSFHPGQIPEWVECDDYIVGDKVGWDGVFYNCIQAHNAGTAPACAGAYEPGVDTDWELYWEYYP